MPRTPAVGLIWLAAAACAARRNQPDAPDRKCPSPRHTAKWLTCAAGALGLWAFGAVGTPGQEPKNAADKVPPEKPVAKPAPEAAPAAANDAAVAQWERHFGPHIRQFFRNEMHFMRLACDPTRAQYEVIAAANEAAVKAATRKFAESLGRGGVGDQTDPRPVFADAIAKSVRAALPPDRAARYEKELELRAAARKRAVVLRLVSAFDEALVLSAAQREALGETLAANWRGAWGRTQIVLQGLFSIPPLPDAQIVPLLTDTQRAAWRDVPKAEPGNGVILGFGHGVEIVDDEWDDRPAPKAPAALRAAEKKAERPAAVARAVPPEIWSDGQFEQWFFQQDGNLAGAQKRFDGLLALQVDDIDRACRLTGAQKTKLQLLGRGDIRRVLDGYGQAKGRFDAIDSNARRILEILPDTRSLQLSALVGPFGGGSLLARSLRATLTGDQFARYDAVVRERVVYRHRAGIELTVANLELGVLLRDAQRRELAALLAREVPPTRPSGHYEIEFLKYLIGRVPEAAIKPLLSDAQWTALARQLAPYNAFAPIFQQAGLVTGNGSPVADWPPPVK